MNFKISVVIPFYNTKKEYLFECLNSLANQTYKNIEVIVINDGSSDMIKYQDILFGNRFHLTIINRRFNRGVSAARNLGMRIASGDYILFVDADDWLEADAIEKMVDVLDKNSDNDIQVLISKCNINDKDKVTENYSFYKEDMLVSNKKELLDSIFLTENVKYTCIDTPWAKLYKKQFLLDENIKFNEKLKNGEDGLFNFEVYFKANSIYFTTLNGYNYRVNDFSVCKTYSDDLDIRFITLIDEYVKFFDKINISLEYEEFDIFVVRIICRLLRKFYNRYNCYEIFKEKFNELLSNQNIIRSINRKKYEKLNLKRKLIVWLCKKKRYFLLYSIIKMNIKIK